jgi:hypothetical protein
MKNNSLKFTVKDSDGKVLQLAVNRPTEAQQREGRKLRNKTFAEGLLAGGFVRKKIENIMKEQNIWDESKQKEWEQLQKELREKELALSKLSSTADKDKGRELALAMQELRLKLRSLNYDRTELENQSVDAQADNAEHNYYVSVCTTYSTASKENAGKAFFKDEKDYLERSNEDSAAEAARHFALLTYGMEPDYEAKLPENKWLIKHGLAKFCDKYGVKLIDSKGHLVDSKGRLIREDGRWVTPDGVLCDEAGNIVDENGNYIPLDELKKKVT